MKRTYSILITLLLLINVSQLVSFKTEEYRDTKAQMRMFYDQRLDDFKQATINFLASTEEYKKGEISTEDLRNAITKTRLSFKRLEFLLAHISPQTVTDNINGAPLPKVERNAPDLNIIKPSGLQTLDELIFSDEVEDSKEKINKLAIKLVTNFEDEKNYQKKIYLTERLFFEACRAEIIRIMSLGITGFDTPGSLNGLNESAIAMESMQEGLNIFLPYIAEKDEELATSIKTKLEEAIQTLNSSASDFNNFDRLVFIKDYLNPLYGLLLDAQLILDIETIYQTTNVTQPVNYLNKDIFSTDFLNVNFFSGLTPELVNEKSIGLGKLLFFDPILSGNNQRACASCHNPKKGFTDNESKSIATDFNGTVKRNSPTLINAVFADRYFYDLRADALSEQVEHVIVSDKEFNTSYEEIFSKLQQVPDYVRLFKEAYPQYNGEIFKHTFTSALAAYVQTLTSYNSPVDRYLRNEDIVLSESTKRGFNLFMGKANCGTCHFAPTFSGAIPPYFDESESEVLGVPADKTNTELDTDIGKSGSQRIREIAPFHKHSFKTVTVRNAALTAPYMHNGIYSSLNEVLDFYNNGGGQGLGFDLENQTLAGDSLNLTTTEIQDIIAFINALTDTSGLTSQPTKLPQSDSKTTGIYNRTVGGEY